MNKEFEDDFEEEFISKSQLKREAEASRELGVKLTHLSEDKLNMLPLSDVLWVAVTESRKLKSNEAKRRHMNFISKQIRKENQEEIQDALDMITPGSSSFELRQNQLERWRFRLIKESQAINELFDLLPEADRQHIRNLVRNAKKEWKGTERWGTSGKKLFVELKKNAPQLLKIRDEDS